MGKINYKALKFLAKQNKTSVKNLVALSVQNDPFYVGVPSQHLTGQWFADLWNEFNFDNGVHLRRIHYRLVSQEKPITMSNGKPYLNTDKCWKMLGEASKAARYLELVDINAFEDRRNPPAIINEQDFFDSGLAESTNDFCVGSIEMPALPSINVYESDICQRYMIEIWCEKSTMNDILEPLCLRHEVNLVTGLGELSITRTNELVNRVRRSNKPTRILYISDFDPAGLSMPVAVARKIEYLIQDEFYDVKLYPVVLTLEQTQTYQLPRTPIKETEQRAKGFEYRFGSGATELDALEALHPGVFGKIIEKAIANYRDDSIQKQATSDYDAARQQADETEHEVYAEYNEEIESATIEWQAITDELDYNLPDDLCIPEPEIADELPHALFDSERDYMEQLQCYKSFQGK